MRQLPSDPGFVEEALWERRILAKTWAMRGTLHLLPADALSLWVAAQGVLKPRHHAASWHRHFGLTREEADAMLAAIADALGDRTLTREELAGGVGRRLVLWHGIAVTYLAITLPRL